MKSSGNWARIRKAEGSRQRLLAKCGVIAMGAEAHGSRGLHVAWCDEERRRRLDHSAARMALGVFEDLERGSSGGVVAGTFRRPCFVSLAVGRSAAGQPWGGWPVALRYDTRISLGA